MVVVEYAEKKMLPFPTLVVPGKESMNIQDYLFEFFCFDRRSRSVLLPRRPRPRLLFGEYRSGKRFLNSFVPVSFPSQRHSSYPLLLPSGPVVLKNKVSSTEKRLYGAN